MRYIGDALNRILIQRGVAIVVVAALALVPFFSYGQVVEIPGGMSLVIDNGLAEEDENYWMAQVQTAGAVDRAMIGARQVLGQHLAYVAVGDNSTPVELVGDPFVIPSDSEGNEVLSFGSLIVDDHWIFWDAESSISPGSDTMTITYRFSTYDDEVPLGPIRLYSLLNGDAGTADDDVFVAYGKTADKVELATIDGNEYYGVSQISYLHDVDTSFVGWAAGEGGTLRGRLENGTPSLVDEAGVIHDLSTSNDDVLGNTLGPADIETVMAWDVDPTLTEASLTLTIRGIPDASKLFAPPPIDAPGERVLESEGAIDPSKPTVVLTHGLQRAGADFNDLWTGGNEGQAGRLLEDMVGENVNVLRFVWEEAGQGIFGVSAGDYISARRNVFDAGIKLANELREKLGAGYAKEIHFIGHSLGSVVNAYGAREYLAQANINKVQFTVLDYPHNVSKIIGIGDNDEKVYGFSKDLFASLLPVFKADLTLKIDNYFASSDVQSETAMGSIINGPVYNHMPLVNSNDLDDTIFNYEGPSNDHSGVQQWYRWTMAPNDPFPGGATVCNGDSFAEGRQPFGFDASLNPCEKGWYWAVENDSTGTAWEERFPANNGAPAYLSTGTVLQLENFISSGCEFEVEGNVIRCVEASSPSGSVQVEVPIDAEYMSFEYRVGQVQDGDYFSVSLDGVPIWLLAAGTAVEPGTWVDSGPLPIAGLSGGSRRLVVALHGQGEKNAELEVRNIQTYGVQTEPPVTEGDGDDEDEEEGDEEETADVSELLKRIQAMVRQAKKDRIIMGKEEAKISHAARSAEKNWEKHEKELGKKFKHEKQRHDRERKANKWRGKYEDDLNQLEKAVARLGNETPKQVKRYVNERRELKEQLEEILRQLGR